MAIIKRTSIRALILSPEHNILLIQLDNPEGNWSGWITPGGGIDEGEDEVAALKRELVEELGAKLEIGEKVWKRFHAFPWKGNRVEQSEFFYLVHVKEKFEPQPDVNAPDHPDLKAFKWWPLEELKNSKETFAPEKLYHYLNNIVINGVPIELIDVGE